MREALLYPGAVAWLGNVPLLALDSRLMSLRPRLAWSLGQSAVDDATIAIADRSPLLVVGPRGLDDNAMIDKLDGNTLLVDLDESRALPALHAARVFTPRRDVRLVLRSATQSHARAVLEAYSVAFMRCA